MKQVDKMPTNGRFVAVWEHNGGIWAESYEIRDGVHYVYEKDEFIETNHLSDPWIIKGTQYFIPGGRSVSPIQPRSKESNTNPKGQNIRRS